MILFIVSVLLVHERIPAYTHTHAWFQFSSLSLCLANALNDPGSSGKKKIITIPERHAEYLIFCKNISLTDTYGDYLYTTSILHGKCLSLIAKCLNEVLVVAKRELSKSKTTIKGTVYMG